jgi:hypothetical protein
MLEGSLQAEYNKYIANPIRDTLINTNTTTIVKEKLPIKKETEIKSTDTTGN